MQKITRVGVYAFVAKDRDLLLVQQKKGPYAGKFDFPGGGIEFGESLEQALRRELAEEISFEFDSFHLIDNLTTTIAVPETTSTEPYTFFQIGLIYGIEGFRPMKEQPTREFDPIWVDPKTLSAEQCSNFLWQFLQKHPSQT